LDTFFVCKCSVIFFRGAVSWRGPQRTWIAGADECVDAILVPGVDCSLSLIGSTWVAKGAAAC
jgi:hypothetical protein